MCCRMKLSGFFLVIGKTAGKLALAALPRLCLMLGKSRLVALYVDSKPLFPCHFACYFNGKTVCVVKVERGYAVYFSALGQRRGYLFKLPNALLQGFGEFNFFPFEFLVNSCGIFIQLGVNVAIFIYYSL